MIPILPINLISKSLISAKYFRNKSNTPNLNAVGVHDFQDHRGMILTASQQESDMSVHEIQDAQEVNEEIIWLFIC